MKVSIVTVTFNSEKTIEDTIISVANQSYTNIEHIIIDGLSSDNTMKIVNKYEHLKTISENDDGIYHAMNKGINHASGEIIGFLNSDDVFDNENVIKNIVDEFKSDEGTDIVYGNLALVKRNNLSKVVRYKKSKPYSSMDIFNGWMAPHPTLYVKTIELIKLNGFNTKYKIQADFELMIRLFEIKKLKFRYLNKTLVRLRLGGASTQLKNVISGNLEASDACKINGFKGGPFFMLKKILSRVPEFFHR